MAWYQIDVNEIFKTLKTTEQGLTNEAADDRLQQYGPNRLAEEETVSRLKILIHQFTSPLIYILLVAAVVTAFLGEYIDTGVILAIVLLNAVIGYIQEYKAEKSVRALKKMVVPKARVLRNGKEKEIQSERLVPGDIVLLSSGAKVPADLRLFRAAELNIDEAMLTGESVPVAKTTEPIPAERLTPGDQVNMAFMGTVVVSGRGRGVVAETGAETILGTIAREVREAGVVRAPLQEKIGRFAKTIGLIILAASALLFLIGILIGESVEAMFMTAVAVAVAAVPEGLPIVVTITLAIGVARMARRNAIIRNLPAVETLGSTTVIGSDKTGTLTKNEMTVRLAYDGTHIYELTGTGYAPRGEILKDGLPIEPGALNRLRPLFRIGLLCTESDLYQEDGAYRIEGDPTEGALIVSAVKGGLDPEQERERYPLTAMIPFESELGYMATLHRHGGRKFIFVKGAPEKIVEMCALSEAGPDRGTIMKIADQFAAEGLRVLAMAYREIPPDQETLAHDHLAFGLLFAGLQGMIDPPRPEAVDAVARCKKAGIRTVMITGDHAVTARAIAKQIGIVDDAAEVLGGKELEAMDDEALFEKIKGVSVYARVSPQHKLRITQQLIRRGEVVAITGDGVNDAPALKAAHIGIAMGKTGTDVAREAADMVLTDDNFASIAHAVEEGRVVFDNIRKVTFFLIPTGVGAILSIFGAVLLGVPIPYVPAQLLWINVVTNGLQDVALAFEPGEPGIIDRPPRSPKEGIMSRILKERTVLVGLIISAGVIYNFNETLNDGASIEKARSVAVTTMVFFQFFQAWNSRSETESIFRIPLMSNPFLFYSLIAAFFAQLAVLYVPALQWVFRTVPLDFTDWLEIGAMAITVVAAVEIDKWLRRRRTGH